MSGGKLNREERTNFHILCPYLLRFMLYFSIRKVKFCLLGLMKSQECVRKWCFHLLFRISSQHSIKGCSALRSVLLRMERQIKLQHFLKFRCIPENLLGGCMALLLQLLL